MNRISILSFALLSLTSIVPFGTDWAFDVAVLHAQTSSSAKRPITHPDLWRVKRVAGPVASPDGKWGVVSVTEPAYDQKDQSSDLWLVLTDGSAQPRRLTGTRGGESGPAWSADSRRIAFSATREGDESAQLYVMDVDGGEARRVTNAATGARSPQWSPDGQSLLFSSMVWPGTTDDSTNRKAASDRRARKYRARVFDNFPVRNWDKWRDDQRPSLWVQPLATGAAARNLLAGSKLAAAPGFSGTMGSGSEDLPATWSPDGRSIVFVATTEWDQAARADVRLKLHRVSVTGGEPVALTAGEGSYNAPRFTSDGQRVVVAFTPANEHTYNHTRLVSLAWPAMTGRVDLTSALDRPAGGFGISPDGKTVFFLSEDAGRERLYSVPVTGGKPTLLVAPTAGTYGNLSVTGGVAPVLIATWEAATQPPEVVRLDLAAKKHVPLTRFTAEQVAGLDLPPLREFTFTSSKGRPIHNFVALPPNFDPSKKYPLFVVIHGGPHGAYKDQWVLRWNYHMLAAPGYVVLLTNYTGSPGFGEKFAQGVQGDPLKTIGDEINEAGDEAIKRFPYVDGTRQVAAGASYGGHLAFWLEATTTRYKALHSHAGAINPASQWGTSDAIYDREINFGGPVWERGPVWLEQNASLKAGAFKTPILVTVGEQDFRVPLNNSLEAFALLQRMQVPSRLIVFPEENHWVLNGENSRFFYQELQAWFARWLGTEKTASSGGRS